MFSINKALVDPEVSSRAPGSDVSSITAPVGFYSYSFVCVEQQSVLPGSVFALVLVGRALV